MQRIQQNCEGHYLYFLRIGGQTLGTADVIRDKNLSPLLDVTECTVSGVTCRD